MSKTMKIKQPHYKKIFAAKPEMAENAAIYWSEVVAHLETNNLVTKTRLSQADRYVRARAEYEHIYAETVESGPVDISDKGGKYFNLLWSAREKLNDRLSKLEDQLMISPRIAEGKLAEKPKKSNNKFLTRT